MCAHCAVLVEIYIDSAEIPLYIIIAGGSGSMLKAGLSVVKLKLKYLYLMIYSAYFVALLQSP